MVRVEEEDVATASPCVFIQARNILLFLCALSFGENSDYSIK
jgi:7-cyano-7-deazaguanine synthase in queuosine biosynthesis